MDVFQIGQIPIILSGANRPTGILDLSDKLGIIQEINYLCTVGIMKLLNVKNVELSVS